MRTSSLFIDKTRVSGIWATWAFLAQERFLNSACQVPTRCPAWKSRAPQLLVLGGLCFPLIGADVLEKKE
jgi:hypothetical protein